MHSISLSIFTSITTFVSLTSVSVYEGALTLNVRLCTCFVLLEKNFVLREAKNDSVHDDHSLTLSFLCSAGQCVPFISSLVHFTLYPKRFRSIFNSLGIPNTSSSRRRFPSHVLLVTHSAITNPLPTPSQTKTPLHASEQRTMTAAEIVPATVFAQDMDL